MRKYHLQTHWFNLLVICATGGLILSVLVAWWIAYSEKPDLRTRVFAIENPASFPLDDARSRPRDDITHYYSAPKRSDGWYYWELHASSTVKILSTAFDATSFDPGEAHFVNPLPIDRGPLWSIVRHPPTSEQIQSDADLLEEARGWPIPCAVSIIETNRFRASWHILWGIQFGTNSVYPVPRVFPTKPIWLGLFVDTIFYGVIVLLLMRIIKSIRSVIRAKRGICCGCGYTMRTLTQCPECGLTL